MSGARRRTGQRHGLSFSPPSTPLTPDEPAAMSGFDEKSEESALIPAPPSSAVSADESSAVAAIQDGFGHHPD